MIAPSLKEFTDRILDRGEMREADVEALRRTVCPQGISSRAEADALIALDRLVRVPECWGDYLVGTMLSFTLRQAGARGAVPSDFVSWLISSLDVGQPTERAARIAAAVVDEAQCADEYLRRLARSAVRVRSAA